MITTTDTINITVVEETFFLGLESSRTDRRKHRQIVSERICEQNKLCKPYGDVKCSKCTKKDVSYCFIQKRSMDEGQSTRFTCNQCNFQWTL